MENIEIGIIMMLSSLLVLHCVFALRAFNHGVNLNADKQSTRKLSTDTLNSGKLYHPDKLNPHKLSPLQTCLWCMLSLLFGPLGYYCYLSSLPLDASLKD
ncbi:MAG: hypothetical protein ACRCVV_12460 [Shewanella sp.]